MRKEYRKELKQLSQAEKKLWRDFGQFEKQIMAGCRAQEKARKKWKAGLNRAKRRTVKEIERLDKRRAILEGRMS